MRLPITIPYKTFDKLMEDHVFVLEVYSCSYADISENREHVSNIASFTREKYGPVSDTSLFLSFFRQGCGQRLPFVRARQRPRMLRGEK